MSAEAEGDYVEPQDSVLSFETQAKPSRGHVGGASWPPPEDSGGSSSDDYAYDLPQQRTKPSSTDAYARVLTLRRDTTESSTDEVESKLHQLHMERMRVPPQRRATRYDRPASVAKGDYVNDLASERFRDYVNDPQPHGHSSHDYVNDLASDRGAGSRQGSRPASQAQEEEHDYVNVSAEDGHDYVNVPDPTQLRLQSPAGGLPFSTSQGATPTPLPMEKAARLPRNGKGPASLVVENDEAFGTVRRVATTELAAGAPRPSVPPTAGDGEPTESWFHGPLARQDADALLRKHPRGSFLVRKGRAGYVLSCRGASPKMQGEFEFAHFPIEAKQLGTKTGYTMSVLRGNFNSVAALMNFLRTSATTAELDLTNPIHRTF